MCPRADANLFEHDSVADVDDAEYLRGGDQRLGTEDVDGTLAHKLKVTRKNGDVNYVYLDPDHFLEIRVVTQRTVQGAQVETETDLGEYEKIGGVFIPFSIEAGMKGSSGKQKLIFEKADVNVPVEDTSFHFPATAAK